MDIRITRPANDEESNGKADTPNHHRRQSFFRWCFPIVRVHILGKEHRGVYSIYGRCYECTNQGGEIWECCRHGFPPPCAFEDDGDGGEEEIEDTI